MILRFIAFVLLTSLAGLTLMPLYWIAVCAFQPPTVVLEFPPQLLPINPTLVNFARLFNGSEILQWLMNSVFVTGVVTLSNVFFATLAGYTLAKKRFPGRDFLFWSIIALMLIPTQLTVIPLYALIMRFEWINSYKALIVPALIGPFSIFLMKQFLQTLPTELLDAARIDGCSEWDIFRRLILPLAKPGMGVLAVFTVMGTWNDFLWPMIVTNQTSMMTLQVGLHSLQNAYFTDYALLMAGAAVSALPMIVAFLLFQPYFVRGVTIGAMKG